MGKKFGKEEFFDNNFPKYFNPQPIFRVSFQLAFRQAETLIAEHQQGFRSERTNYQEIMKHLSTFYITIIIVFYTI